MKIPPKNQTWPVLLLAIGSWLAPLPAQIAGQPVPPPVQMDSQKLNPEELGHLLAPIALYPDALVALILPASTVSPDVVMAARYLKANGDPANTENQPWDESVKSLARYPDVLAWMDENLEWTTSVGEAFVEQPADVMAAIQALREQAKAAGNLVDSPQQNVVEEDEVIRIVPADPEVIYVPQYDPQIVYVQSYSSVPVLTFGIGFAVGSWLCYDFDWRQRCFYRGNWCGWNRDRHGNGNHGPDGNRGGTLNINFNDASRWQPGAGAQRQADQRQHNNTGNARYISSRPVTPDATGRPAVPNAQTNRPAGYNPELKTSLPRPKKLEHPSGSDGRSSSTITPMPSTPEATKNSTRPEKPQRPGATPRAVAPSSNPATTSPKIPVPSPLPPSAAQQATPHERPHHSQPPTVPTTAALQVPGQQNLPKTSNEENAKPSLTKQPDPPASSPENTPSRDPTTRPAGLPPPCPVAPDQNASPSKQAVDKPQIPRVSTPTNPPTQPAQEIAPQADPKQEPRRQHPQQQRVPVAEAPASQPVQPTPPPVVQSSRQPLAVQPVQQQQPQVIQRPQTQPRQQPPAVQPVQQQQPAVPAVQPQSPTQQAPDPRRRPGGG